MTVLKQWREAASLIIASRAFINNSINNSCNFKVLILKRNDRTAFMPGSYVFPGGVVDCADSNVNWINLFKQFGVDINLFPTKAFSSHCPLFEDDSMPMDVPVVPKSVSLRIAAIRETFEECGVLLCKTSSMKSTSNWVSYLAGHEVNSWQAIVQNNPCKFIELCNYFKCYPDIWSLHLWSNWLTPIHHKRRFDTAFFVAACDELPPVYIDNGEIVQFKWQTPEELLALCSAGDILLPPPQHYELARLRQFSEIKHLHECATHINTLNCEQWMPVQIKTSNGIVLLLPGDCMYPDNPDKRNGEGIQFEGTLSDLKNKA